MKVGAQVTTYHFRFVAPGDASNQRPDLFPLVVNYSLGISLNAMLPFIFACDVSRRKYWRASATLLLMLFHYPVTLTKVALFAPFWLLLVLVLLRVFGARLTVILSLLLPGLVGLLLVFMHDGSVASFYFFNINFRILAIPAAAMDVYNEFFSKHEVTRFCQIWMLKPFISCPYSEQLSIVMRQHFPFGGNFNASLFATEGIASVGSLLAPIPVLVGGSLSPLEIGHLQLYPLPLCFHRAPYSARRCSMCRCQRLFSAMEEEFCFCCGT